MAAAGQPVPVQLYDNSGNAVVLYVPDSFPVDEQGMPCYATPKTSEFALYLSIAGCVFPLDLQAALQPPWFAGSLPAN